jgi:hypothetical protein
MNRDGAGRKRIEIRNGPSDKSQAFLSIGIEVSALEEIHNEADTGGDAECLFDPELRFVWLSLWV